MTGLSGAGKTTVANCLAKVLMKNGRHVTVFDGDAVRAHLSKDPYEPPSNPDVHLVTVDCSPERCCQRILDYLRQSGLTPDVAAQT